MLTPCTAARQQQRQIQRQTWRLDWGEQGSWRMVRASYEGVMSTGWWGDKCVTVCQDLGAVWV